MHHYGGFWYQYIGCCVLRLSFQLFLQSAVILCCQLAAVVEQKTNTCLLAHLRTIFYYSSTVTLKCSIVLMSSLATFLRVIYTCTDYTDQNLVVLLLLSSATFVHVTCASLQPSRTLEIASSYKLFVSSGDFTVSSTSLEKSVDGGKGRKYACGTV